MLRMRTATIEQVLGPVAQLVGDFILTLDNEQLLVVAADNFYTNASIVADTVGVLMQAVQDIVNSTRDEQLKAELPKAANEVKAASNTLMSAVARLRDNPTEADARTEQRRLIEGAKGILLHTAKVLECMDDYEIRRILSACTVVKTHVEQLMASTVLEDAVTLLPATSHAMISLAKLVDHRVSELLSERLKTELQTAKDVIRSSATLFMTSYRVFLVDTSKVDARDARDLAAQNLNHAIKEVERIVLQLSEDDTFSVSIAGGGRVASAQADANNAEVDTERAGPDPGVVGVAAGAVRFNVQLLAVHNSVHTDDAQGLQEALAALTLTSEIILTNAADSAKRTDNAQLKAKLTAAVASATKSRTAVASLAQTSLSNPNDQQAKTALLTAMKALDGELSAIKDMTNEEIAEELLDKFRFLGSSSSSESQVGALTTPASQDEAAAREKKFSDDAKALAASMRHLLDSTADPEHARAIRVALNKVDRLVPQVLAAVRVQALNKDDSAAKEHLTAVLAEWDLAIGELKASAAAAQEPDQVITASLSALRADVQKFAEATQRKSAELVAAASADLVHHAATVTELAHRELSNDENPAYQKALQAQITAIEQGWVQVSTSVAAVPAVTSEAKTLAANTSNTKSADNVRKAGAAIIQASETIETTVHDRHRPRMDSVFGPLDAQLAAMQMSNTRPSAVAAATAAAKPAASPARTPGASVNAASPAAAKPTAVAASGRSPAVGGANGTAAAPGSATAPVPGEVVLPPALPVPLSAAEAKAHPIRASAQHLTIVASRWEERGNTLVSSSKSAAEKMKRLSDGLHSSQPKLMIESASGIFSDIKAFEKAARSQAAMCTDKVLREQLLANIAKLPTIASQLKILSTVQASNPNQHDNDPMLESLASRLMDTVRSCLEASETASMRSNGEAATPDAMLTISWRRQIFDGQSAIASLTTPNKAGRK